MVEFSVVIPTYNRAELLQHALESVLAQEYRAFEIIVVDDGSTDATESVLESFRDKVRVLYQENKGPGAARNLGARNSVGAYIAFLDSDDLWFPWTLASYSEVIQNCAQPAMICGSLKCFSRTEEIANVERKALTAQRFADYFVAARHGHYCGSGQMAVRRDAFLSIRGFVEERINAEDHDFVMRLGTASGYVHLEEPAMVAYRQHSLAATQDVDKTNSGISYLLDSERSGKYPGGSSRRWDRRRILLQHARSLTLKLLERDERSKAWTLYRRTFGWHLCLGRVRYLVGFVVRAAFV